jgi:hypothetical protein
MNAEDQVAQGRFAGPVLTQYAVNLAGGDGQRYVFEGDQGSEPLSDTLERKQRRVGRAAAWFGCVPGGYDNNSRIRRRGP